MDDVRGRFFSLPSSDGQRLSELKEFKLKRTLLHLSTQGEGSVDNRNQSHQSRSQATPAHQRCTNATNLITPHTSVATTDNDSRVLSSNLSSSVSNITSNTLEAPSDFSMLLLLSIATSNAESTNFLDGAPSDLVADYTIAPSLCVINGLIESGVIENPFATEEFDEEGQDAKNAFTLAVFFEIQRQFVPQPKRTTQYIAAHHYDPAILQAMVEQGLGTIDTIPAQLIKELDLEGQGYTAADIYKGDAGLKSSNTLSSEYEGPHYYVPTPSYKRAKRDYKLATTRYRLNKLVDACRARRRARTRYNSTLAPRGSADVLQPVAKRSRMTPLPAYDPENPMVLQRAIIMLSNELEEASAEIVRLNDVIKVKEAMARQGNANLEKFSKETMGGLNRLNMSSDTFHKKNRNVARTHFGIRDRSKDATLTPWQCTKNFLFVMFGVVHQEPTLESCFRKDGRRKKFTDFEQCLMTLMWLGLTEWQTSISHYKNRLTTHGFQNLPNQRRTR